MMMPVRWKEPKPGERVRVKNCEIYFYLTPGLPDQTDCTLIRRETGCYIVEALGRQWEIPLQCLVHEEERQLNGVWLDARDRRVQKSQAMIDRLHASHHSGHRFA